MNEKKKNYFLDICKDLIEEADNVISSKFDSRGITFVDKYILSRWWGKVKSFIHLLGPVAKPWYDDFNENPKRNTLLFCKHIKGTLEAIYYEIENDHLATMYQIVRAETLSDLFEQAELLLSTGYYLAAGVLGRAVLEESLRNVCIENNCLPQKDRPTLNDFNQELYKSEYYSKTKMKHIDILISIGNSAAHNKSDLEISDVKKLIQDIPSILDYFSN